MPDLAANMLEPVGGFPMQGMMMRYNLFMPRLYNWCMSLGFESGKIMPSRAFCSDESQGYPVIMIARHFGTFPFNHGLVGGVVATDRHSPHASHGQDLVIIQASHVGYDPESKRFGTYRRLQTANQECSSSCGKIHQVLSWYENEFQFAQENIRLHQIDGQKYIIVDNQLLRGDREEGLLLRLDKLIEKNSSGQRIPQKVLSTSKVFTAAPSLVNKLGDSVFTSSMSQPISHNLTADMFYYQRNMPQLDAAERHLEHNLIRYMPQIMTTQHPGLLAAQINTQVEFDLTFRSIAKEESYQNKKILFIAGLNIDISPKAGQLYPLTKFVPWAAYFQDGNGTNSTVEQDELAQILEQQSTTNKDKVDLEKAISTMAEVEEIKIEL